MPPSPASHNIVVANVRHALSSVGRTTICLLLLWLSTLWWGERTVFKTSATACAWENWEKWPSQADPHHVLLIADPQLVDPHTYPGRPWPLTTLTIWITDLYMRRTYHYLLEYVQPHSTVFLGDLFDGGREWATVDYESSETIYKKYGTKYWLGEYTRFMEMFVDGWYKAGLHYVPSSEGRRLITSLPGNHDLGFGGGINPQVKSRFEAHFGPVNRIDILGNHSFVSIDTVSLSAIDQVDPETGSSGTGDGTGLSSKRAEIWKPVEAFLLNAKKLRARAVQARYNYWMTETRSKNSQSAAYIPQLLAFNPPTDKPPQDEATVPSSKFPTVVLSHVPLSRNQDASCGPMREKGSSIPLSYGYQYQNVLTPMISSDIVQHLDASQIVQIYSGDDHDYCEIEHGEFTGNIREITVKSTSMAMGVQRPGVQLASLWNPIDLDAIASGQIDHSTPKDTIQNHLCLLPFQEGIFVRYLQVFVFTLLVLVIRAIKYNPQEYLHRTSSRSISDDKSRPLLPLSRKHTPPHSPNLSAQPTHTTTASSARARTNGKLSGYGNIPSTSRSVSPINMNDDSSELDTSTTSTSPYTHHQPRHYHQSGRLKRLITRSPSKIGEFMRTLQLVAGPAILFYVCLLWNG